VASVLAPPAERAGMTTPDSGGSGNGTQWTLRDHEKRLSKVEDRVDNAKIDVVVAGMDQLRSQMDRIERGQSKRMDVLEEDVGGLKKTIIVASLGLTSSALIAAAVFALSQGGT
jgi:hypothetical protein